VESRKEEAMGHDTHSETPEGADETSEDADETSEDADGHTRRCRRNARRR